MAVMERRLITGTTTLGLRYSMLNLEEETRGNVFFNYDASSRIKRVGFAYMTKRFVWNKRRIADFTPSWL
jgi:hypothetical protein